MQPEILSAQCYSMQSLGLTVILFPEGYLDESDICDLKVDIELNTLCHCNLHEEGGQLGFILDSKEALRVRDYLEYFSELKLGKTLEWM